MFRCVFEDVKAHERNGLCVGPSSSLAAPGRHLSRKKLPTPQPNDLWRFFPANDQTPSPKEESKRSFVEELLRHDDTASERVEQVMSIMELFESATSSWGAKTAGTAPPSRKWFPSPETKLAVPSRPAVKTGPLVKQSTEGATLEERLEQIPTWRVFSAAVFLSQASKDALLERCPPKLNRISADHMSLIHSPDAASLVKVPLGKVVKLMAYGEKCGVVAQHVALKPPKELQTQKSHPHVTVSFAERVLKKDIAAMKGNGSFEKWIFPVPLEGVVGIKMDTGRVLFSDEEFYVETGIDLAEIRNLSTTDVVPVEESDDFILKTTTTTTTISPLEEVPADTRPSEEIRRLMAQDSFSSRPEESMAQSSPDTEFGPSQMLDKSCTEASEIVSFPLESAELKVLHVGKPMGYLPEIPPQQQSSAEKKQLEVKKKQAELRVECEMHRQASWKEQRKGEEYLEMARAAYCAGQREVGDQYNRVSIEATLKHREHTDRAERLAFEASNLGRINTHTIDLHHLHLQEALARLRKVTQGLESFVEDVRMTYRLKIITGKGMNSFDNVPVLRPAVLEFLKSHGLDAEIDEYNEGVVLAYILPRSTAVA